MTQIKIATVEIRACAMCPHERKINPMFNKCTLLDGEPKSSLHGMLPNCPLPNKDEINEPEN